MSLNREGWQKGRWALALFLMVSMTSAAAAQFARKGSSRRGGRVDDADIEDALKPQLLNADTNPTLRYPIGNISGWSVNSLSYGWLDVSQGRIHYSVMQPAGKLNEGFDIPTGEISEVKIEMYLQFHRDKKKFNIFYLPQDRWGSIHSGPGTMAAASQGSLGTGSIYQAIKNFDRVLAMVKPPPTPPPVVAQPLVSPAPEPKPAAPPVIVLSAPLGARADQTLEVNGSPLDDGRHDKADSRQGPHKA